MNELSGLKPYTCNDHIKDKNDDMVKKPSIAANIFNDHFCSIHSTFSNTVQPGSNVHVDRLKQRITLNFKTRIFKSLLLLAPLLKNS